MTAESSTGILSNAVQTEGNVYLNSAGKHSGTRFEVHGHGGAWSKQSQPLSFLPQNYSCSFPAGAPHALTVLHNPKVGRAQEPMEKRPGLSS